MPQRRTSNLTLIALGMLACMTLAAPTLAHAQEAGDSAAAQSSAGADQERVAPAAVEAAKSVHGTPPAEQTEENIGFPQLNAKTYPSQVLWLFVAFAVLYGLMSKLALPRVGEVLDARRSHKEGDLKRAEQLQEEAAKVKTAYEAAIAKAQAEAQDAQRAAEQDISEKIAAKNAEFGEKARKKVATAEQAIARAKDEALASLADISADVAAEMVNKVAGVQVNKADAKKAVSTVMNKEAA